MENCNLKTVMDAGASLAPLKTPANPTDIVLVPNGYSAIPTDSIIAPYLANPRHIRAAVKLDSPDSFIRYVEKFKNPATLIFAKIPTGTQAAPKFQAIIDYHSAEIVKDCPPIVTPDWCSHGATFEAVFTEEWKRWMAKDRLRMNQEDFALLLEENADLIIDPKGADLLEIVQTLEGKADITCNSLIRLNNGRQKLVYEEQVTLKGAAGTTIKPGEMEFPTMLTVAIAPFEGGVVNYGIKCRLRYRIESRKLLFWFEVVDRHLVIKDAVSKIVENITSRTGIEPLNGSY